MAGKSTVIPRCVAAPQPRGWKAPFLEGWNPTGKLEDVTDVIISNKWWWNLSTVDRFQTGSSWIVSSKMYDWYLITTSSVFCFENWVTQIHTNPNPIHAGRHPIHQYHLGLQPLGHWTDNLCQRWHLHYRSLLGHWLFVHRMQEWQRVKVGIIKRCESEVTISYHNLFVSIYIYIYLYWFMCIYIYMYIYMQS